MDQTVGSYEVVALIGRGAVAKMTIRIRLNFARIRINASGSLADRRGMTY
jgi:hypothetical protein